MIIAKLNIRNNAYYTWNINYLDRLVHRQFIWIHQLLVIKYVILCWMTYHFDGGYICKYVCVSVQCGNKQRKASRLRLWKREYNDTWKTRCVDDMPTSEVTSVIIPFIHPPHHGHTKVTVMVINDRLTSLSLHVNRPSDFWDKFISNIALEKSRPRPCLWSKVRVTYFCLLILHTNQTNNFRHGAILKELFQNLTLKNSRSNLWVRSKVTIT